MVRSADGRSANGREDSNSRLPSYAELRRPGAAFAGFAAIAVHGRRLAGVTCELRDSEVTGVSPSAVQPHGRAPGPSLRWEADPVRWCWACTSAQSLCRARGGRRPRRWCLGQSDRSDRPEAQYPTGTSDPGSPGTSQYGQE
ncbi:hypothetical protein FAGKG844_20060 [Frankia sp. AgKG'84/4]